MEPDLLSFLTLYNKVQSFGGGSLGSLFSRHPKDSKFQSLSFGQAIVSMYQHKGHSSLPEKKIDEQDQLQFFCYLNSPQKLHTLIGQVKNRIH